MLQFLTAYVLGVWDETTAREIVLASRIPCPPSGADPRPPLVRPVPVDPAPTLIVRRT